MRILKKHPLLKLVNDYVVDSPQPSNLSYLWNFGSLLAYCLVIQIVTGVTLAMHYNANILDAFDSVEHIMRDVNNGWLIRYLHSNTASAFFFIVYLHIGRGLYYGSYKAPRTLVWTIGTVIFILMIATAFLGYVLPYGQMSLWGATVITNLMSAIPWVGQDIVQFIWGGFSVNNATLNRFFALHFVLPFILAALALMHLIALHGKAGSGNPLGISGNQDRLPFAPYFIFKDLITIFIFMLVLSILVFYAPNILGDSENYVMANPMQTPPAIVPEWYLLPFYAILRSIPNKLLGVIAMFSAILSLLAMPFADLSRSRGIQFKPLSKIAFFIFIGNFLVLTKLGAKHVEFPFIEFGQISTVLYFAHFFIIIPVISLIENSLNEVREGAFEEGQEKKQENEQELFVPVPLVVRSMPDMSDAIELSQNVLNASNDYAKHIRSLLTETIEMKAAADRMTDSPQKTAMLYKAHWSKQSVMNDYNGTEAAWAKSPPSINAGVAEGCAREHVRRVTEGHLSKPGPFPITSISEQPWDRRVDPYPIQPLQPVEPGAFGHRVDRIQLSRLESSEKPPLPCARMYSQDKITRFQTAVPQTGVLAQVMQLPTISQQASCDAPRPWGIYFQDSGTPQMEGLVELHDNIMYYLVIILFGVGWILRSIINKYNFFASPIARKYLSHGTSIELIWTVTPAIILILIAFPSFKLLYLMDEVSDASMAILAEGHQWYWSYQYADFMNLDEEFIEFDSYLIPEPDLEDGALRMLEVDNRLIVPELTHIRFVVAGADVIHSFACPSLGIKCDAYPGRLNQISVMVNRAGTFYGQCSEICGILHSSMPIVLEAVSIEKFISWLLQQ